MCVIWLKCYNNLFSLTVPVIHKWGGGLDYQAVRESGPGYSSALPQPHPNKATGNSRGICHHKIPEGNSREFLHIASLIFFLLESALCNLSDPGLLLELLQYRTSNSITKLPSAAGAALLPNCLLTVCHIFHFRQAAVSFIFTRLTESESEGNTILTFAQLL